MSQFRVSHDIGWEAEIVKLSGTWMNETLNDELFTSEVVSVMCCVVCVGKYSAGFFKYTSDSPDVVGDDGFVQQNRVDTFLGVRALRCSSPVFSKIWPY